ncbi:MAG: hypothetical protein P1S60_07080 [Anaerolineae bacterium]|nr:hypothetical protein [Anaerolineae bacterium]
MGNRTSTIKNLDEMYWYGVVEASSKHFATVIVTSAGNVEIKERAGYASGNTGSLVVFPKFGLGSASGTLQVGGATADTLVFAASTAPNLGQVQATPEASGTYFAITGGTEGDVYEVYLVPSYSASNEVNWIDDFSAAAVPGKRNESLRGTVDHKKRVFNQDKTMSLTQRFSNAAANLLSLSGNNYTLIGERQDDDGGITSETLFIFGSYHEAGLPTGSVGDNDDTISLEATYNDFCWINGDGN